MTSRRFSATFYESGGKWPWVVMGPNGKIADGIALTVDEASEAIEETLTSLRRDGGLHERR